jgi:transposase-like protein
MDIKPSGFPVLPRNRTYSAEWRADCIAYVLAEREKGRAIYSIAALIGVSEGAIVRWIKAATGDTSEATRRARIVQVAASKRRAGMTLRVIADQIGVDEKSLSRWMNPKPRAVVRAVSGKPRNYLRCDKIFRSEGAHNRMCNACRNYAPQLDSPYSPDPGGETGKRRVAVRP